MGLAKHGERPVRLLAVGAEKRRFPREYHAFILGIPLDTVEEGSSPLVVWEGSHAIVKRALGDQLGPHPPERWHEIDVTEAYHAARREAFDQCRPVALTANAGEVNSSVRTASTRFEIAVQARAGRPQPARENDDPKVAMFYSCGGPSAKGLKAQKRTGTPRR